MVGWVWDWIQELPNNAPIISQYFTCKKIATYSIWSEQNGVWSPCWAASEGWLAALTPDLLDPHDKKFGHIMIVTVFVIFDDHFLIVIVDHHSTCHGMICRDFGMPSSSFAENDLHRIDLHVFQMPEGRFHQKWWYLTKNMEQKSKSVRNLWLKSC